MRLIEARCALNKIRPRLNSEDKSLAERDRGPLDIQAGGFRTPGRPTECRIDGAGSSATLADEESSALGYSPNPMKPNSRKKEWFDDNSFWRELYPFMFSKERIAAADEQIAKVLALTRPAGKSVLDLCCGPGRCSIALVKRGFSVTGVDKTKYLLIWNDLSTTKFLSSFFFSVLP
jgi:hypothetical protein